MNNKYIIDEAIQLITSLKESLSENVSAESKISQIKKATQDLCKIIPSEK